MQGTLIIVLCIVSAAYAVTWPRHVATHLNENVTLQCNPTRSGTDGQWQRAIYGSNRSTKVFISSDGFTAPGYTVSEDDPFDLTIEQATPENIGTFECELDDELDTSYAKVMLIRNLVCSIQTASETEGADVTFECRVDVYGGIAPNMHWTRDQTILEDGDNIMIDDEPSRAFEWRTMRLDHVTQTTKTHDKTEHVCRVFWEPNLDTTHPVYEAKCSEVYRVRHVPRDMLIRHDGSVITSGSNVEMLVGDYVNCTVSSHPAASMTWEHTGGVGPTNPELLKPEENMIVMEITSDMMGGQNEYTCVAERDGTREAETIMFTVERGGNQFGDPDSACSITINIFIFITILAGHLFLA